jgi:hypothetical protein
MLVKFFLSFYLHARRKIINQISYYTLSSIFYHIFENLSAASVEKRFDGLIARQVEIKNDLKLIRR